MTSNNFYVTLDFSDTYSMCNTPHIMPLNQIYEEENLNGSLHIESLAASLCKIAPPTKCKEQLKTLIVTETNFLK